MTQRGKAWGQTERLRAPGGTSVSPHQRPKIRGHPERSTSEHSQPPMHPASTPHSAVHAALHATRFSLASLNLSPHDCPLTSVSSNALAKNSECCANIAIAGST